MKNNVGLPARYSIVATQESKTIEILARGKDRERWHLFEGLGDVHTLASTSDCFVSKLYKGAAR